MKTLYTLHIKGMTCHACEALITMDLEDAGLPKPISINHLNGILSIEAADTDLDKIKDAVQASKKYTVIDAQEQPINAPTL